MITDNRTMNELRVACFGDNRCLGDVLAYFNKERAFPNIERELIVSTVSRALDHDDPNLVYTALACVKKMTCEERKGLEPKISGLAKHANLWIRTEVSSILDLVRNGPRAPEKQWSRTIRLPDMGAAVPVARMGRPTLRLA